MKFAPTIKNLFIALTVLSVISLATSRRSKTKVAASDAAIVHAAKVVEYEATLQIKDATTTTEHQIKIDQDSFNQMNYGIEFSLEKGAITNSAFFLVSANHYLFNFKNVNSFNCLNQATFTVNRMHFSVYINKKEFDIVFIFPNGWAFNAQVNIRSLCNKFYDRWSITQSKRNGLEAEIMKLFSHIKLLQNTQLTNTNTKQGLQTQNSQFEQAILATNSTINSQRDAISKISNDIDKIGFKQADESKKLNDLQEQIKENETKMKNQQDYIDSTKGDISAIKQITDAEINNEWAAFKVVLQKMIDLQSNEDPLKTKLNGYISNVKGNVNSIMSALSS